MKTGFDGLLILFNLIADSPLKAAITGSVYKQKRPSDSGLEDIVINDLGVNTDQFQRGTFNVNIYVPDLKLNLAGVQQIMPDSVRLKELVDLAVPIFSQQTTQQYNFWLVNVATLEEPSINQHYVNLRIDAQFFPT